METIGEITVDDSGSVALPQAICERLGFAPGEKLLVERDKQGEARLKSAGNTLAGGEVIGNGAESLARIIEEDGVLVITFATTEPLPEQVSEWLKDPVQYDREMRMREILKGSGLESFD